jgi:EAL and modified HD-GYP domain-containing signal transduction protein
MAAYVYLGRQPIFDKQRRTYGYELLYRNGPRNKAFFVDPDDATRHVVEVSMLQWGFDKVVGDRFGFINAGPGVLASGLLPMLPANRAVVEMIDDTVLTPDVVQQIADASFLGIRFALGGDLSEQRIGLVDVAPHIGVVKLDTTAMAQPEIASTVERIKQLFPDAMLLATKLEDPEQFRIASQYDIDLFQGFFFAKPEVMQRKRRPTNLAAAVQLLAAVNAPDIDIDRIEEIISSDPSLAYGVLKVVNSSSYGITVHVKSIRHAVVMLGIAQVRQLAVLLTMANNADDVSEELVVLAACRARMASILAGSDDELATQAFTAGLLSVIDALFHTKMEDLVADLPLEQAVRRALVESSGPVGNLLSTVYAFERADTLTLELLRPDESDFLREAFATSVEWAEGLRAELAAI